jgi:hypothetical protein
MSNIFLRGTNSKMIREAIVNGYLLLYVNSGEKNIIGS